MSTHPTISALAAAVGVTERTLELWRMKGAPIPNAPPYDEIDLRLWHLATISSTRGKRASILIDPPAGSPIAAKVALIHAARDLMQATKTARTTDPATALKREQVIGQKLQNSKRKQTLVAEARAAFNQCLGRLCKTHDADTATVAATCWTLAQSPRLDAEPAIARTLKAHFDKAMSAALTTEPAKATP